MKDLFKDKKMVILGIVIILVIIGVIIWLRRKKKEESGFVMSRGFFPSDTTSIPISTPTIPPPAPAPAPAPAPEFSASSSDSMGVSPAASSPTPAMYPHHLYPPYQGGGYPMVSYPYGVSYPPAYYPFPRTYEVVSQAPVNKGEYIDYLQRQIAALELAYDDAISNFMFGRAFKISRRINELSSTLHTQLGY